MHLRIRKRPVSFQFLVTCIFVPVVLAASLTTFVASFRIARNNQKETISESTATVLKLTTNYLNGRLNDVLALMMNVQNSPELQRVIRETDSNGSPSNEAIADFNTYLHIQFGRNYSVIDSIAVVFNREDLPSFNASFQRVLTLKPNWDSATSYEFSWRDFGESSPITTDMTGRETAGLAMVRLTDSGIKYGIFIDIRDNLFRDSVSGLYQQMAANVVLLGDHSYRIFQPGGHLVDSSVITRIPRSDSLSGTVETAGNLVVYDTLVLNGWKIAVVFDNDSIFAGLGSMLRLEITSTIIIALASVLIVFLFAGIVSRPIHRFSLQVASLDLDRLPEVRFSKGKAPSEEISQLQQSLDALISRLRQWQDENIRMHNSLLLSQINPHFMYNTLYAIMQECNLGETKEAGDMLADLANFFRLGLNAGKEIVPLKDEVEHTTSYLKIIQRSFTYSLHYSFDIPEELLNCQLPKMTLQPLVENSFRHGIRTRRGDGFIWISAKRETDGHLSIFIRDNGIGMDASSLAEFCNHLSTAPKSQTGFGTYNVNQRIKGLFGPMFGLSVESSPGVGTTVTIHLPCQKENAQHDDSTS